VRDLLDRLAGRDAEVALRPAVTRPMSAASART